MRNVVMAVLAALFLLGPLSSISQAGVVCAVQEKLGVDNVKDCEDYLP